MDRVKLRSVRLSTKWRHKNRRKFFVNRALYLSGNLPVNKFMLSF